MGNPVPEDPPVIGRNCENCNAGETPSILRVTFENVANCASCNWGGGAERDLWKVTGAHGTKLNESTFLLEQGEESNCQWDGEFDWIGKYQHYDGTQPPPVCVTLIEEWDIEKIHIQVFKTPTHIKAWVFWYSRGFVDPIEGFFYFDDVYPVGLSKCINVTLTPNFYVCNGVLDWGAGDGKMIIEEI